MRTLYCETYATAWGNFYAGKAWVARITGLDPKYGFARTFLSRKDVTEHRTNVYRDIEIDVPLTEGACYEYRASTSSSKQDDGFWVVRDGKLMESDRHEIKARFAAAA